MHKRLVLTLIGVTPALQACGTEVCACSPAIATAVVFGRVTSPEGTGVPGARVTVAARTGPSCPAAGVEEAGAITEPAGVVGRAGRFRAEVLGFEETPDVCLAVWAEPPVDSAGLGASATEEVTLDLGFNGTPDSVQVQLILTRQAASDR